MAIPSYQGRNEIRINQATLMAVVQNWLGRSATIAGDPKMEGCRVTAVKFEDDTAIFTVEQEPA